MTQAPASLLQPSCALPFSGLGHDLSPVCRHAEQVRLVPAYRVTDSAAPVPLDTPALYGFGLLVALGREIRGR
ncbi:hypothetical protein [Desulfovibrio subterraneus]|uniref:Uncharacterized protein n=1 Tax=Desulfovibrio subterraneus TaxID=2718620 RepID=A0A7J0BF88_9BACT|nr:hypothetical protein [Desulfovibrio subterraneus]GFM31825.1 hypothetical protein DSM101010T_01900 [Desulfovibrio subterraneus]